MIRAVLSQPSHHYRFTERDYENGIVELQELLRTGYAPKAGKLLDLGCGAGNYSIPLAKMGYEVSGVDISQTAISWATENVTTEGISIDLACGDGIKLDDFRDSQFDFIFDGHFLHCIIGEDRRVLLKNVHRVLRPEGFFLVRSIVWPVETGGGLVIDPDTKLGYLDGVPYRYYPTAEELVNEIKCANFSILDWHYTVTSKDGYGFQHAVLQCARI